MPAPRGVADLIALRHWMADHAGADPRAPLRAHLLAGGRSNLTFSVVQGESRWVLRRPPLGPVLPSAHDMRREFTVLRALQQTEVPVPRAYAMCEDADVIGAPFYVMEHAEGRILRSRSDVMALDTSQRAALSRQLIATLAQIHGVPWADVGLGDFGRPDGFVKRQISRWARQWELSRTRSMASMEALTDALLHAMPRSAGTGAALLHGDFRLDNVVFSFDTVAPGAVLDWEMSAIGDPLTDLGLMLVYWPDPEDDFPAPSVAAQTDRVPGFLPRREMAEEYQRCTGRPVESLWYYMALGYFKLAVILEGLDRRHRGGLSVGAGFEGLADEVPTLVERASRLIQSAEF